MSQLANPLQQIHLAMLAAEVQASAAIEGVMLPREAVLAAVARRLGLPTPTQAQASRVGARKVGHRQRLVIELLASGKAEWIDARGYMAAACVSKATATRDLAELVNRGELKRAGTGKASRYSLSQIVEAVKKTSPRGSPRMARAGAGRCNRGQVRGGP